ncbi:DNA repair protein RecN [Chryseolinea sp. T2]|uniref:DNA repair protein RecN n=1 Tax=Chryseolinea sp. T2 TaxID=3129255 RepID=UPI003077D8FF
MLKQLTIKNYALIRQLSLEPSASLNVITGETGAGKSILLGAMGLLMGNRADSKVLLDEDQKCIIEGTFDIGEYKLRRVFKEEDLDYDDQTVIRRELSPGGKSRAFINDTPVTVDVMKRIGGMLMDIHSQHETLLLGQQAFQLRLVDAFAGNHTLLETYATEWTEYQKARKRFEELTAEADTLRQEADYIGFQLEELEKMGFEETEQDTLESEVRIMDHASDIKGRFKQVLDLVTESEYAARNGLSEARGHLQQVASIVPAFQQLQDRLESVIIELDDLMGEVEREGERVEFDPERAEVVRERLNQLYRLLKKHKAGDLKALLVIQAELGRKNELTSNLDEALAAAEKDAEQALTTVTETSSKLSAARKKVLAPLGKQISSLLGNLGMPNATLQVDAQKIPLSANGTDRIDILFSANKGIAPRPLSQVASGGEFSRLMFSIKYVMAEKSAMPTLVLDEIDSGISGEVAIKLGNMMKVISKRHQIISISHLPQIAAKADAHYFVFKDHSAAKTTSSIRPLSEQERVSEIAKMIGGEKPSRVALENAQELLNAK